MTHFLIAWSDLGHTYREADKAVETTAGSLQCPGGWLEDDVCAAAFRMVVAINAQLEQHQKTVELFQRLDRERPARAEALYTLAETTLHRRDEHDLIAKYSARDRTFPVFSATAANIHQQWVVR